MEAPTRIWAWSEDCGDVCVNGWVADDEHCLGSYAEWSQPYILATAVDALVAEAVAAERERLAKVVTALTEIAEITERKENKYPDDWRDQIAACPECQRYKDHPIQSGICDIHRKPIYAQADHDQNETRALGYRAKTIARDALYAFRSATP